MLSITRKIGQAVLIGDTLVTIASSARDGDRVRLDIDGPDEVQRIDDAAAFLASEDGAA